MTRIATGAMPPAPAAPTEAADRRIACSLAKGGGLLYKAVSHYNCNGGGATIREYVVATSSVPFPPSASIFRTFFKYHGRIAFFAYTKTASRGNTGTRSAGDRTEIGVFPVSACSSRKSRNTTRQPALLWPDGEHCLLASGRPSLRSGRAQNKRKPKRVYSPGGASSGVPGRGVAEKRTFFALVALMSIIE